MRCPQQGHARDYDSQERRGGMNTRQALRFELDPNNVAASRFASHCGASSFAYNTMLAYVHWALDARAFEKRTTGQPSTQVPWNLYVTGSPPAHSGW